MNIRDILIKTLGPKFYHKIKNIVKKALCFSVGIKQSGKNVYISPRAIVRNGSNIVIGDNSVIERGSIVDVDTKDSSISISSNCYLSSYCVLKTYGGYIRLGSNCTVNNYAILYGQGGLDIGNYVRIAAQVVIMPMNHIYEDPDIPIFRQGMKTLGIKIEDDVWLGAGAKILDGVVIGQGSVIGAGAVVSRNIPPYSVAVGIPAKVIKQRKKKSDIK